VGAASVVLVAAGSVIDAGSMVVEGIVVDAMVTIG
jgi:hypothetical protein